MCLQYLLGEKQKKTSILRKNLLASWKLPYCSEEKRRIRIRSKTSTVDWYCVDSDPDPNLYVDADPDPDPDWHQNNADPHADPSQVSHL